MEKFVLATRRFLRDEEGVVAMEYGLMAALIAVGIITAWGFLGGELGKLFTDIAKCLSMAGAALC